MKAIANRLPKIKLNCERDELKYRSVFWFLPGRLHKRIIYILTILLWLCVDLFPLPFKRAELRVDSDGRVDHEGQRDAAEDARAALGQWPVHVPRLQQARQPDGRRLHERAVSAQLHDPAPRSARRGHARVYGHGQSGGGALCVDASVGERYNGHAEPDPGRARHQLPGAGRRLHCDAYLPVCGQQFRGRGLLLRD